MPRTLLPCLVVVVVGCSPTPHDPTPDGPRDELHPGVAQARAPIPVEPSPFEHAIDEQLQAVRATTVEVEKWSAGELVAHGSGVLVSPAGDILTAAHVAHGSADLRLRVRMPDGQTRDAVVEATDDVHDAALLQAPGGPTPFAHVASRAPRTGEWVVCAGYGGQTAEQVPMATVGTVVAPRFSWSLTEYENPARRRPGKTTTYPDMLRLDCTTARGMSGGPVVDLAGNLVGVVVGSDGTAASIETVRHLLPAPTHAPTPTLTPTPAPAPPASRAAAMTDFASRPVQRSIVELKVGTGPRFPAVLVTSDGLAVVPAVRIEKESLDEVAVVSHPGVRCAELLAVRGEVALVRLTGLAEIVPVGPPGGNPVPGQLVAAVDAAHWTGTFVTALDRHPGDTGPDPPEYTGGCGTAHRMAVDGLRQEHPSVLIGSAMAHDGPWEPPGTLLVDRLGHPVGIEVAVRAPGLSFAIPWTEVLARFDEWLRPS